MEAQAHSLQITQTARYFSLGTLNASTPALWMVCHGYGQLAPYFIKNFQILADAGHYIVAPEGLSRFYLKGFSGRVGASWMTKEDRQTDMFNYVHLLSEVHKNAFQGHSAPLNLLGFSQGVATISRWGMESGKDFKQLILWAGVFPPDLPMESSIEQLKGKEITVVCGNADPLISRQHQEAQLQTLKKLKVAPKVINFAGGHELNAQILKNWI